MVRDAWRETHLAYSLSLEYSSPDLNSNLAVRYLQLATDHSQQNLGPDLKMKSWQYLPLNIERTYLRRINAVCCYCFKMNYNCYSIFCYIKIHTQISYLFLSFSYYSLIFLRENKWKKNNTNDCLKPLWTFQSPVSIFSFTSIIKKNYKLNNRGSSLFIKNAIHRHTYTGNVHEWNKNIEFKAAFRNCEVQCQLLKKPVIMLKTQKSRAKKLHWR